MRGPRSLTGRVTLAAVGAVGGALAVAGIAVVLVAGQADRSALDRDLQQLVVRLGRPAARLTDELPAGRMPPAFGERDRTRPGPLDPGADRFARVILPAGTFTAGGAAVPNGFPVPVADGQARTVRAGGERWRTIVRALGGGERLQVAARLEPLESRQARLRLVVLAALAGALVATALATRSLARLALRPLARLRGAAGAVAETADLAVRVPEGEGPEEVDALAGDLNAMLGRLQEAAQGRETALRSARRFAADAGHELRTPLTSLRANLTTGSIDAATRDATRLTALVEQLQALARGEAGPPPSSEDVDLGELADAALAALRARHPGIDARLEAPQRGPFVPGEAESLRILIDNLLENAARHGRPDGTIVVTARPGDGGGTVLLVDDDGPGVPVAERGRVLERFARGDGAHGEGTGLGLAIARVQAARHRGGLTLGDSPLGGLRVRVTLAGTPAAGTATAPATRPPAQTLTG